MRVSPATAIGCFSHEADASTSLVHNWRDILLLGCDSSANSGSPFLIKEILGEGVDQTLTMVPARPSRIAWASSMAPIAAIRPVLSLNRQAASTFGAIEPDSN